MSEARERLTRSAGIVSAAVMASRVLGLVREMTLAHFFATGLALDAFNAAFRIPNMLRDLFGEGALSKAFVTVFTDTDVKRGEAETWRLASRVLNLLVLVATVASLLGIVFAPQLVAVMLPGEGFDTPLPPDASYGFATKRDLTVFLTRIMFPFVLLVGLAAVSMGILNSKGRFGVAALSSAFFNVGSLAVGVAGYFAGPRLGIHPVVGMAVGVLAGGLLQWLVQVPALRHAGFRWVPELSLSDPGVRQIGRLIGPATIGVAAVQINVLVNMVLASQGSGWFSWLNVSFRLMYLPIGVFGVAISTANLPALARHAAGDERAAFRETLSHALRLLLLLTIPSSVGLAVLSRPIIGLIYEHGAFTAHDADMAAGALLFYALGLSGYSAVKVVTDAFYALNDTATPLRISVGAIALNVGLGSALVFGLGWDHRGLALSMSIAVMLNFLVALAALRARIGRVDGRAVVRTASRTLAASLVMGAVCWAVAASVAGPALQVGLAVPAGVAVFGVLAWVLRLREIDEIVGMIRRR
jgi:putative peptidoglycan lipid II flippase